MNSPTKCCVEPIVYYLWNRLVQVGLVLKTRGGEVATAKTRIGHRLHDVSKKDWLCKFQSKIF